jgi:DNA-binding NtrC family response regulator
MPGSRILIVDDEKTIADSLALVFSKYGYETRAVYDAEQAIEIVKEWEPALAIIDVILPNMSGIDLAVYLKAAYPALPVLLISGQFVTESLIKDAANRGHHFEILAKPVPIPEMLRSASSLLATP